MPFKLTNPGKLTRDGCSYDVELNGKYYVGTFMYQVLKKRKDEWGTIRIVDHSKDYYYWPRIEYKYGEIVGAKDITEDLLRTEIDQATAFGGWSAMDYSLYCKVDV